MVKMRDRFPSEEQLDLKNLSEEELYAWWDLWLEQAQATNDLDEQTYSHGVFAGPPFHREDEKGTRNGDDRAGAARPSSPKSGGPRGGGTWNP